MKPAIGAGSRDAQRFGPEEKEEAAEHAQRMLHEKRSVLLQPYLNRVDEYGETALIYFEGKFSHAIRKGPLLKRKEGPTHGVVREGVDHGACAGCGGVESGSESDAGDAVRDAAVCEGGFD